MTKQEAITAMMRGKKVTHHYFSPNEWMTIEDHHIITEDGCRHLPPFFWQLRTSKHWEDGYELFEEKPISKNLEQFLADGYTEILNLITRSNGYTIEDIVIICQQSLLAYAQSLKNKS